MPHRVRPMGRKWVKRVSPAALILSRAPKISVGAPPPSARTGPVWRTIATPRMWVIRCAARRVAVMRDILSYWHGDQTDAVQRVELAQGRGAWAMHHASTCDQAETMRHGTPPLGAAGPVVPPAGERAADDAAEDRFMPLAEPDAAAGAAAPPPPAKVRAAYRPSASGVTAWPA